MAQKPNDWEYLRITDEEHDHRLSARTVFDFNSEFWRFGKALDRLVFALSKGKDKKAKKFTTERILILMVIASVSQNNIFNICGHIEDGRFFYRSVKVDCDEETGQPNLWDPENKPKGMEMLLPFGKNQHFYLKKWHDATEFLEAEGLIEKRIEKAKVRDFDGNFETFTKKVWVYIPTEYCRHILESFKYDLDEDLPPNIFNPDPTKTNFPEHEARLAAVIKNTATQTFWPPSDSDPLFPNYGMKVVIDEATGKRRYETLKELKKRLADSQIPQGDLI